MSRPVRRESGFTLIEAVVSVAIFLLLVTSFASAFATTDGLSSEARVAMRANEEHRKNLEAGANLLRGADLGSLSGFAADGTTSALSFQSVQGVDTAGTPILGPVQEIKWRSTTAKVTGIAKPGEVVIVTGGTTVQVMRNVPEGGFVVRQQGSTLKVALQTYYATSRGRTATVSGESSVTARN
jgi:type II secretory pathway pseudopilin PulG